MKTVLLKACKRCSGDMALRRDFEAGLFAACVQCGHVAYPSFSRLAAKSAA